MNATDLRAEESTLQQLSSPGHTEVGELRQARFYAEGIVSTIHGPSLILTPDLRLRTANPALYKDLKVGPTDPVGQLIYELGNSQWNIPEPRTFLEGVLLDSNVLNDSRSPKTSRAYASVGC